MHYPRGSCFNKYKTASRHEGIDALLVISPAHFLAPLYVLMPSDIFSNVNCAEM